MIIDAHVHIHENGKFQNTDGLIHDMETHGIEKAVIIAVPGIASNRYVLKECERYPDQLAALVFPDFASPKMLPELKDSLSSMVCCGIKIHPRVQNISPTDKNVYAVMDVARELNVPVMFDSFLYGPNIDSPDLSLFAVHKIAQAFSDVKIILAHAGGHRIMDALIVAKSNHNIYLDISFIIKYFEKFSLINDIAPLCIKLGSNRIIYGSDYPEYSLQEYLQATQVAISALSENDKQNVMHNTAFNLYFK